MRVFPRSCLIGTLLVSAALAVWAPAVADTPDAAPGPAVEGEDASGPELPHIELVLTSDREVYAVGDVPTYSARSSEDCYLTLINVDPDRSAVVLFPNEFEQDNRLQAGRELKLPKADSPYKFRLAEAGRETLVGICTQTSRPPAGIRHDFGGLRFTMLGDWDEFLARSANGQADAEPPPSERGRAKTRQQREEPERNDVPDRQARTEISYEVH